MEVETEDLRRLDHEAITKEKAAFVDCQCEWGLFRAGPLRCFLELTRAEED